MNLDGRLACSDDLKAKLTSNHPVRLAISFGMPDGKQWHMEGFLDVVLPADTEVASSVHMLWANMEKLEYD